MYEDRTQNYDPKIYEEYLIHDNTIWWWHFRSEVRVHYLQVPVQIKSFQSVSKLKSS